MTADEIRRAAGELATETIMQELERMQDYSDFLIESLLDNVLVELYGG